MILTQISYSKGNEVKITVVLLVGRKGNKVVCILDKFISKRDSEIVKRNINKLKNYNLASKLIWIKSNLPVAYKKGYRELPDKFVKIIRAYSLINNKIIK